MSQLTKPEKIYISSPNDFALKKSQSDFLQKTGVLHHEPNIEAANTAQKALNTILKMNEYLFEKIQSLGQQGWYKASMERRLEMSSTIAMLNSRSLYEMKGYKEYVEVWTNANLLILSWFFITKSVGISVPSQQQFILVEKTGKIERARNSDYAKNQRHVSRLDDEKH